MNGARPAAGGDRNLEIEVLRCIAIVFTLLQHIHVLLPHPEAWLALVGRRLGFWTGVDLFFVVSGFVIMRNLRVLTERHEGRSSRRAVLAFWVKRAFRLLPTAWAWLLLPLLASFVFADSGLLPPLGQMWQAALAAMLNLQNALMAWCMHAGAGAAACDRWQLSSHYWSLSLEEQFYVVLPILLLVLPRRLVLPLAIAGIALFIFVPRPLFSLGWYFRVDGFLWGIALALLCEGRLHAGLEPRLLSRWAVRVPVTGVLLFALAWVPVVWAGMGLLFTAPHQSYAMAAIACVGGLLVWVASYDRGYLFGRSRWLAPLVYVGARSYSIYVIHLPVFQVLNRAAPGLPDAGGGLVSGFGLVAVAVVMTFAFAELNYRFIETPLRERGRVIAARIGS